MKEPLEKKLETLRVPRMPSETEARIRRRIAAERLGTAPAPMPHWRRHIWRGSYAQLALLAVLLAMAGWVLAKQVYPVLVSAWERYCVAQTAGTGKPR